MASRGGRGRDRARTFPNEQGTVQLPQAASLETATAPDVAGSRYVDGVWVGGDLTHVDYADSDVTPG
jgi:hypothetical protein